MDLLKDIDEAILGPDGTKDKGEHMDDKYLLNGFLDGMNQAVDEKRKEIFLKFLIRVFCVIVVFFVSFYIIMYAFLLSETT